jgi:hypothetical protein
MKRALLLEMGIFYLGICYDNVEVEKECVKLKNIARKMIAESSYIVK